MSRVLLTGATGFVGGAYAHHLRDSGHEVVALVRDGSLESRRASTLRSIGVVTAGFASADDIRTAVAQAQPDRVVHLATHYVKEHGAADVVPLIAANVEFGTVLLDALSVTSAIVLTASSFFQFENGIARPHSLYSASKEAFSSIVAFYRERRGMDVREVILYDTYGPDDERSKLIPAILRAIRDDAELRVGSPLQPLHLVHMSDVCAALDAAMLPEAPTTSAVRLDRPVTIGQIAEAAMELSGGRGRIVPDPAAVPDETPLRAGDWPGPPKWRPIVSLRAGLRPLVATAVESLP